MNSSEDDELLRVFDHGMFSSRGNGYVLFKNTYDASKKSEYQKYMEEEQALNRQPSTTAGITMNDVDLVLKTNQRIHVVILQHGFQGSQPIQVFRDYLTFLFPHFKYLMQPQTRTTRI